MKRLLLLACGFASFTCLGLLAIQAGATAAASPALQYSRPAAGAIIADRRSACLQSCDTNYEKCHSQQSNGAVCVGLRQHCIEGCNERG